MSTERKEGQGRKCVGEREVEVEHLATSDSQKEKKQEQTVSH